MTHAMRSNLTLSTAMHRYVCQSRVKRRFPVSDSIPVRVADPIDPPDGSWLYGTGGKLKWRTGSRQRHRYRSLPLPPVMFFPTATSHSAMRRLYNSALFSFIPFSSYVSHPFYSPERRALLPLSPPPIPDFVPVTLTNDSQIRRLRNNTRTRLPLSFNIPSACSNRRPYHRVRTHAMD